MDPLSSAQARGEAKPPVSPHTRFVARQPILTKEEKVFGYELLFRDGVEDYFRATDPDAASRDTLDSSILLGLDVLCGGQRAFINCTREVLLKDYMTLLPPNQAVAEILESVPGDDLVKAACARLKEAGFMIALDDFMPNDARESLTEFADIIKVDIRQVPVAEQPSVQELDRLGRFFFRRHLDEAEATRVTGDLVGDDPYRLHGAGLLEELPKILFGRLK